MCQLPLSPYPGGNARIHPLQAGRDAQIHSLQAGRDAPATDSGSDGHANGGDAERDPGVGS